MIVEKRCFLKLSKTYCTYLIWVRHNFFIPTPRSGKLFQSAEQMSLEEALVVLVNQINEQPVQVHPPDLPH